MAELPPRLSEQQKFILAHMVAGIEGKDWSHVARVSWDLAEEFNDHDDPKPRILDPDEAADSPEEILERTMQMTDDLADATWLAETQAAAQRQHLPDEPTLKNRHSASVSRSIRRLAERDLLERKTIVYDVSEGERVELIGSDRTTHIFPTDEGADAGEEVRRRLGDGRYSLSFDQLTVD
jgi:hypothetical protein